MNRILTLTFVSLFITTGSLFCYDNVTPEEVHTRLVQGDTLLLLDVREVAEYLNGHIAEPNGQLPLTPALMQWNSGVLAVEYSRLPADRDIIVYCQSGGRSALASAFLETNGFTRIFNMTGGFSSWTYESRPNGYGDHSGQWVNAAGVNPVEITCPGTYDTSKIIFPPFAVPVTDSIYVELHYASFKPFPPPNVPQSDMDGLFRLTALDRFGLTMFEADSLLLTDTTSMIIFPEFTGNIVFYPELKVFVPGEGWRTVASNFSIPAFFRTENILRKWYNGEGFITTDVIALHSQPVTYDVQVFPNPFNGSIKIIAPEYSEISVYDIRGRLVEKLNFPSWNPGEANGSGIYIITVEIKDKLFTKGVVYLK
jgi:rhodanese-related sulfurtransferase